MDSLQELLPGIEEFLVTVLAGENLSSAAEEKRLYFVERLDILKLPPSIPPRPGRKSVSDVAEEQEDDVEVHKEEVNSDFNTDLDLTLKTDLDLTLKTDLDPQTEDFAAYQREISRNLGTIPPTEHSDTESEQGVKVYDDIDIEEHLDGQDDSDADEQDLYEIPVARLQLSEDSATGANQSGDRSSLATAASIDDIAEEVADVPIPPPLPPRRDRTASDLTNQSSGGGDDKPPDLPARPVLPPRGEVYEKSDRSEKSDKSDDHADYTLDGGGDSTSYESYEEDNQYHDVDLLNKLNIKLPKRPKKKQNKLKKKLSKSRSSSNWEINVPFKKLEDMALSGDLQYKGKLSWTRKLVALSNGNLACYKPDKETKPQLVVHLTGYEVSIQKDSRKGYEIKLSHPSCDTHIFSVDFKEWAQLWMDHISAMAKGLPPPSPYQHLARTSFSGSNDQHGSKPKNKKRSMGNHEMSLSKDGLPTNHAQTLDSTASLGGGALASPTTLARWDWKTIFYNWMFPIDHFIMGLRGGPDLNASNSNLSTSSDGLGLEDGKARLRGNKVMRMGSFAYRATQFFENLGKKSGKRKMAGLSVPLDSSDLSTSGIVEERSLSAESAPPNLSPYSDFNTPVFDDPESPGGATDVPSNIKHQGYLNIFSSFNRRRWGKRWCLVRENMFECYRNEKARQYELNLLLKNCVFRRAVEETSSEFSLMLLEDGKEKITVEPLNRDEMGPWVHILMAETSTEKIPDGLEEYFTEDNHSNNSFPDILGYSVIKSWEQGNNSPRSSGIKVVNEEGIPEEEGDIGGDDNNNNSTSSVPPESDSVVPVSDVYSEVQKKGKNSLSSPESPEDFEERKHTTDSGFYSVKGSNSDSESDSGCVLRSEEETHGVHSPTQTESRKITPTLSPRSKKKANGVVGSGLHIRFCLDTENNNEKENGEYDAIEVTFNKSQQCCDTSLHNESPQINDSQKCCASSSPDVSPHSDAADLSIQKEEVSDLDGAKSDVNVNDSIEIAKCDMLNSSSDAETVKSSTASVVSLSDKLEQNASAVSSDLEEAEDEGEVKKDSSPVQVQLENTENNNSENTECNHGNTNSSSSSHGNRDANTESAGRETSDSKSTMEEFDKDIQQRIGRLREKLVQIKRKRELWEDDLTFSEGEGHVRLLSCRIAVRDKRLRASSAEEEKICDDEYSHLDQQCHETDQEISQLEQQLTAQVSLTPQTSS